MNLFIRAYFELIRFDLYSRRKSFVAIRDHVLECPARRTATSSLGVEQICYAFDLASIWYWKEVLCLQRSAATAVLLKRFGFPAKLVIGTQHIPFKSHAWVELAGQVVNDKPYMREIYPVIDQC